ncbi:exonuclease [Lactobacillus sp. S2-2]|uniref:3'-5' exonuclease n=1 Tax=Lactobacillus sp. S2-2 TaxID=2692917 RepID=UPI001F2618E2|nr:3'-5' exonuclease [Lactobacillus sp. S2-2]MCF6515710.1 exonuclease [Lactobacillus sp. S2-2]
MNFIAIDFETANSKRDSACSVAVVVVRNNQITDKFYSLINPETEFNFRNVQIHGIKEQDVINAPTFPQIWSHIENFFRRNKLVIAHNATFDNSVIKKSLERYGISKPDYLSLDTLKTSKYFYKDLDNYKLNTISDILDINLKNHHNALADSIACAEILISQSNQFDLDTIKEFVKLK